MNFRHIRRRLTTFTVFPTSNGNHTSVYSTTNAVPFRHTTRWDKSARTAKLPRHLRVNKRSTCSAFLSLISRYYFSTLGTLDCGSTTGRTLRPTTTFPFRWQYTIISNIQSSRCQLFSQLSPRPPDLSIRPFFKNFVLPHARQSILLPVSAKGCPKHSSLNALYQPKGV
jgi:hypothetical protein